MQRTNSWGFAGTGSKLWAIAQVFDFLRLPDTFFTVLSARLRRIVVGSVLANSLSFGPFNSLSSFQVPCKSITKQLIWNTIPLD